MKRSNLRAAMAALALTLVACGSGGGGDTTAPAAPQAGASSPGANQVTGISTPSGVSVVTAKNAQ
jgi:ABC-type glycerol-3-phosphate transport system substrate-binding protein